MRRSHAYMAIILLSAAAPAAADWLVTSTGEKIETRGEWEVRGAQVVFRTLDGRLSALRATEVDLEASRTLTDAPEPTEPKASADSSPHRSVLVLTDANLPRARPVAARREVSSTDSETASEDDAAPSEPDTTEHTVEILDWQDRVDVQENVLLVTGRVVNRGSSLVTDAGLRVRLVDETGTTIEESRGIVAERVLQPGAIAPFTAAFAGSPGFVSIEFEMNSRGFRLRAAEGQ